MVWCALHALADIAIDSRVGARGGHNFVEQLRAYAARTAEGEQHAPRLQNLEGQAVDVLVGTGRTLGVGSGGREFGRIEHDGVKCFDQCGVQTSKAIEFMVGRDVGSCKACDDKVSNFLFIF